jgi:hypothetical protein
MSNTTIVDVITEVSSPDIVREGDFKEKSGMLGIVFVELLLRAKNGDPACLCDAQCRNDVNADAIAY